MAVKTKAEILDAIKAAAGDNITSDEYVQIIEDITDSMDESLGERLAAAERRADEVEETWRKRYTDRFFSGDETRAEGEVIPENGDNDKIDEVDDITIDDLFEEVKEEV